NVASQDLENAVGVNLELNADTRHPAGSGVEINGEIAEAPVVPGAFALALEHMDEHLALVVHGGGEHFAGFHWNGGVARDNDVHQSAEGFETERERGDIEEKQILESAGENLGLDRRAQRDSFVGILGGVELGASGAVVIRAEANVAACLFKL